jgi:hypothetical protein
MRFYTVKTLLDFKAITMGSRRRKKTGEKEKRRPRDVSPDTLADNPE